VMDEQGRVKIVDRKKDMISVSGFKVFPNEVEDVAMMQGGLLECAVVGVPDKDCGEAVKLFAVKKKPELSEEDLRAYLKTQLTGYKMPKHIEFRPDLPKILEAALQKAMAREVKKRYQTIPALAHDLVRACPLPGLTDLANEFSAPSSTPTILSGQTGAPASAAAKVKLEAPTGVGVVGPSAAERQRRGMRPAKPGVAAAKPAPAAAPRLSPKARRALYIAAAVLLVLFGIWLGRRGARRTAKPVERYLNAERGVEATKVRVLTQNGEILEGTVLKSDKDGLLLQESDSPVPLLLRPGSWQIVAPLMEPPPAP